MSLLFKYKGKGLKSILKVFCHMNVNIMNTVIVGNRDLFEVRPVFVVKFLKLYHSHEEPELVSYFNIPYVVLLSEVGSLLVGYLHFDSPNTPILHIHI